MPDLLEIVQLGNPILRQPAQPVADFNDATLQGLIDSLLATAAAANGVGIAAPQVAQPYRLFIVASRPNPRYPHAPVMEPTAMLNPRIIDHSADKVKDWEGCLSIPGIRGLVPRYRTVTVEYWNRQGQCQQQQLTDFVARIFQHELDHLNGIVFLDRVESTRDLITEQEWGRRGAEMGKKVYQSKI
jgi:peptide deformylase